MANKIEELQAKIDGEHAAIEKAQARKADLNYDRAIALEAYAETEVEKLDIEIGIADTGIARNRERIALLEQRIEEAKTAQREADLDAQAAAANEARVAGEQLIAKYAKHAQAIGELMPQLAAVDELIDKHNRVLQAAGRAPVPSPNAIRCKKTVRTMRTERRRVGVGESCHPMHAVAVFDRNGACRHRETGESIEPFGEFDVETPHVEHGYVAAPLHAEVKLPRVQPDAADYWPNNRKAQSAPAPESTGIVGAVRELFKTKAA